MTRSIPTFVTFLMLAATLFAAPPAAAGDAKVGDLMVEQAWARATVGPMARAGAAYFTLHNMGASPDRLVSAATPAAKRAELHTHLMEGGVMKMRPVEAAEVDPGAPVVFQPGGLHVMMMGLEGPLKEGATFPLTLTFEKAGTVEVEVEVRAIGAQKPAPANPMGHGHNHGS